MSLSLLAFLIVWFVLGIWTDKGSEVHCKKTGKEYTATTQAMCYMVGPLMAPFIFLWVIYNSLFGKKTGV